MQLPLVTTAPAVVSLIIELAYFTKHVGILRILDTLLDAYGVKSLNRAIWGSYWQRTVEIPYQYYLNYQYGPILPSDSQILESFRKGDLDEESARILLRFKGYSRELVDAIIYGAYHEPHLFDIQRLADVFAADSQYIYLKLRRAGLSPTDAEIWTPAIVLRVIRPIYDRFIQELGDLYANGLISMDQLEDYIRAYYNRDYAVNAWKSYLDAHALSERARILTGALGAAEKKAYEARILTPEDLIGSLAARGWTEEEVQAYLGALDLERATKEFEELRSLLVSRIRSLAHLGYLTLDDLNQYANVLNLPPNWGSWAHSEAAFRRIEDTLKAARSRGLSSLLRAWVERAITEEELRSGLDALNLDPDLAPWVQGFLSPARSYDLLSDLRRDLLSAVKTGLREGELSREDATRILTQLKYSPEEINAIASSSDILTSVAWLRKYKQYALSTAKKLYLERVVSDDYVQGWIQDLGATEEEALRILGAWNIERLVQEADRLRGLTLSSIRELYRKGSLTETEYQFLLGQLNVTPYQGYFLEWVDNELRILDLAGDVDKEEWSSLAKAYLAGVVDQSTLSTWLSAHGIEEWRRIRILGSLSRLRQLRILSELRSGIEGLAKSLYVQGALDGEDLTGILRSLDRSEEYVNSVYSLLQISRSSKLKVEVENEEWNSLVQEYLAGAVDQGALAYWLSAHGVEEWRKSRILEALSRLRRVRILKELRGGVEGLAKSLYVQGNLSDSDLLRILRSLDRSEEYVNSVHALLSISKGSRLKLEADKELWGALREAYVKGRASDQDVLDYLEAKGYTEEERTRILNALNLRRSLSIAEEIEGKVTALANSLYTYGEIDESDYVELLMAIGKPETYIRSVSGLLELRRIHKLKERMIRIYKEAVKKGTLDLDTFTKYLRAMAVPEDRIAVEVSDLLVDMEEAPLPPDRVFIYT